MLVYRVEFARQQVDLPPLRGDGCIQFLDGLVLVGDAGFEGFEALGKVGHGDVLFALLLSQLCSKVSTA